MGRSSSNRAGGALVIYLDRLALGGLTVGLALYVMPFWPEGRLRAAFWLTLVSTLLHIFTSHRRSQTAAWTEEPGGGG